LARQTDLVEAMAKDRAVITSRSRSSSAGQMGNITDVHEASQAQPVADGGGRDPASGFLARQTDLVEAMAKDRAVITSRSRSSSAGQMGNI
ncbi:hypothetical protein CKF46_35065, partial [Klebsiella pneumoniae]